MEFIKSNYVILVLVLVVVGICFISSVKTQKREAFSDYINLEKFNADSQLSSIEDGVSDIKKNLEDYQKEQQDMSKFVYKSELKPQSVCKVNDAIDKDNYISKTLASKDSCPVPPDYDPSKFIAKSVAEKPRSCPACPTLDHDLYVLKSTLPVDRKCPDCKCPKVQVSAGLCKKCPPPPKCPPPQPCPQVKCPAPKACPPPPSCPACPQREECPPKICPPCDAIPQTTPCPKCCDRDVVKVLQKTVYVDQNGNQIKSDEVLNDASKTDIAEGGYTNMYTSPNATVSNSPVAQTRPQTNNTPNTALPTPQGPSSSNDGLEPTPTNNQMQNSWLLDLLNTTSTSGSGLATPAPTLSSVDYGSNTLSGSLEDQSNADNYDVYTSFPTPTERPIIQNYNVAQENETQKKCTSNAFNHEFQQFGVYGRNHSNNVATY